MGSEPHSCRWARPITPLAMLATFLFLPDCGGAGFAESPPSARKELGSTRTNALTEPPLAGELTPPQRARSEIRQRRHTGTTRGLALGYVQCNLVILPQPLAYEFLLYCQRNQRACPVLEVTDAGAWEPKLSAPGADLRTDLPRYAVYRHGRRVGDETNIVHLWQTNFVSFLIGSGITFDEALQRAGVPTDKHRWVLRSQLPTVPAGRFHGNMVVTMRWLTPEQAVIATQVTARFPFNHGAPIHIGDPAAIGADLKHPLFGPPVESVPKELVAVFWACGVTPQAAAESAGLELMITHAPAHGFITDLKADQVCLP
jgi:uncharacterized protein YcsI (UPF0317 family)